MTGGTGTSVVTEGAGPLGESGAGRSSSSKNDTSSTERTGDGAQGGGINDPDGYVKATAVQCQASSRGSWRNDNFGGVTTMVLKSGRAEEHPVPDTNRARINRLRDMGNSDSGCEVLVAKGEYELDF